MVLSQGLGIKLAKRIGMKKTKVAIVRKIAVILTASGVPVLPLNVIGQRPPDLLDPVYRTSDVPLGWRGTSRRSRVQQESRQFQIEKRPRAAGPEREELLRNA